MNETLKVIASRYSCRGFSDQMPDDAAIKAIAEAGIAAPSASNTQKWRVIVTKNKDFIKEIDEASLAVVKKNDEAAYNRIMGGAGTLLYNAPVMYMLACPQGAGMDCGILAENITLAAASLGLSSLICWMAGNVFFGEQAEEFKAKMQFPEGYDFGISVLVGYPTDPNGKPHTPDPSKIIYLD